VFWIWVRGGPRAVFAFIAVVAVFLGLYVLGSQFAPWVPPFLIVPAFVLLAFSVARSMRHRDGGSSPPPDSE
jgi:uncharacterized membrane protein YjgN (DUF898 family)